MNNTNETQSTVEVPTEIQAEEKTVKRKKYPTLGEAFGLTFTAIFITLGVGIPIYIIKSAVAADNESLGSLLDLLAYTISFVLVVYLGLRNIKRIELDFKLKWNKINMLLLALIPLISVAFIIVIEPVASILPMPDFMKEIFEEALKTNVFGFMMIVIAAPILEELLFRGIILEGLLKNYSPQKAILWSAFLFGFVHLNPWQFISAGLIGVLIGWLYYKTNSLIPGILIHFLNNFIAFMMMHSLGTDVDGTLYQLMDNKMDYYLIFGASILVIGLSILLIKKKLS